MRKFPLFVFILFALQIARGQTDYSYRYWINDDKATVRGGTLPEDGKISLSVDGHTSWLNYLHFQICDNTGKWSPAVTRSFMLVEDSIDGFSQGAKYRYWIDDDAGSVKTGDLTSKVMPLSLSAEGLTGWLHYLHFQVCDNTGKWSPAVTRNFMLVEDSVDGFSEGARYRYWIDDDAGSVKTGDLTSKNMPLSFSVESLTGWLHYLHFQVCDNTGKWSPAVTRLFIIVPDLSERFADTAKFCYWIDDQPATVITGNRNANIMELNLPIDTLAATEHTLYLQVQDKFGIWSQVASATFTLTTSDLTIMATGNGTVRYNNDEFRDDVKDYETVVGNTVELTLKPDDGYSVSRVILNGTEDVTERVDDNKISVYATEGMSISVNFELTDFTKLGDVNNDGRISVADLSLSVDYLVGGHPSPFVLRQADANNDGEVNVGDVARIVDLITGAVERGRHAPAHYREAEDAEDNVLNGQINSSLLTLDLANTTEYTCFQLSLTLPEGVDVKDLHLTRGDNHVLSSGVSDDGLLKVVVYSGDNSPLEGTDGQLLQVQTTRPLEGEVLVDDIVFVTKRGHIQKFNSILINGTTGISVKSQSGTGSTAFDLNGRQVLEKPRRGIYIISGKKIIFK